MYSPEVTGDSALVNKKAVDRLGLIGFSEVSGTSINPCWPGLSSRLLPLRPKEQCMRAAFMSIARTSVKDMTLCANAELGDSGACRRR